MADTVGIITPNASPLNYGAALGGLVLILGVPFVLGAVAVWMIRR